MSIDLSWEEVRHAIVESGFEIKVSERGCKAERELRVLLLLGGDGLHDEDGLQLYIFYCGQTTSTLI